MKKADLDKRICDCEYDSHNEQTYREFITESEGYFEMSSKDLDELSDKELNEYINYLDHIWCK